MAKDKELNKAAIAQGFGFDVKVKPMDVEKARKDLKIGYPHIKAEDLVDTQFIVYSATPFEGSYESDMPPFFCECRKSPKDEIFTTTLGGQAVSQFLIDYILQGAPAPLMIVLRHRIGGEHGGYYVIE